MYRHGDVLLKPIGELPQGAKETATEGIVLAYGEVTGHAHRVHGAATLLAEGENRVLVVEDAYLDHEEHGRIDLESGIYEVLQQREYHPERVRWVSD